jgi:dipeptidyl aminopeptidase/acylaminoacyl peptidase
LNYALFASRGYVVAAVNFHGSTGYCQLFATAFPELGRLPYEDLIRA